VCVSSVELCKTTGPPTTSGPGVIAGMGMATPEKRKKGDGMFEKLWDLHSRIERILEMSEGAW